METASGVLTPRQAFDRAATLIKSSAYSAADVLLAAALETHPNDPNLLRMQGISLARQKRFEDAESKLTHVIRLAPGHAAALEELADVQLSLRKLEPALESLRAAINMRPSPLESNSAWHSC